MRVLDGRRRSRRLTAQDGDDRHPRATRTSTASTRRRRTRSSVTGRRCCGRAGSRACGCITSALKLPTQSTHRPEVTAERPRRAQRPVVVGLRGHARPGQAAPRGPLGGLRDRRAPAGIKRRRSRFCLEPGRPLPPVARAGDGRTVAAVVTRGRRARSRPLARGPATRARRAPARQRPGRAGDRRPRRVGSSCARPAAAALEGAGQGRSRRACSPSACAPDEDSVWDLAVVDGERRLPLALDDAAHAGAPATARSRSCGRPRRRAARQPAAAPGDRRGPLGATTSCASRGTARAAPRTCSIARGAENGFSHDFAAERDGDRFRAPADADAHRVAGRRRCRSARAPGSCASTACRRRIAERAPRHAAACRTSSATSRSRSG